MWLFVVGGVWRSARGGELLLDESRVRQRVSGFDEISMALFV